MGAQLKRIAFIYLISYLAVAALGSGLFPALTMKLFLSNGDYGVVMPRMVGAIMGLLSFLLFVIYRMGDWKKILAVYDDGANAARPINLLHLLHFRRPHVLDHQRIVLLGLVTTAIGTVLERRGGRPLPRPEVTAER